MKKADLANGQVGYLNLKAENTTDFNSISIDDMDCQFVNNLNFESIIDISLLSLFIHYCGLL
jgi:hypothetical protein